MSEDRILKLNFDLTLKYLISPRTDKPLSSRFLECTTTMCVLRFCQTNTILLRHVIQKFGLSLLVLGLTIPWERGKRTGKIKANSLSGDSNGLFPLSFPLIKVINFYDLVALAGLLTSNLNLNLNLVSTYIVIYSNYYMSNNIDTSSNIINNMFQQQQYDNPQGNNVNVPQNSQNQQQQPLSNVQIANALNNLNQAVSNVTFNRQIPLANNQNQSDQLLGQMDNQLLLSVQQTFWSNQIKDQKFYCKRCGGIKHVDPTNCPKRCNRCFGNHATKDCPNKLLCRWCGSSTNPHNCEYINAIKKMAITCPLCKIRGHSASECNSNNMGLSKLFRILNSFRTRRRNLPKNKAKSRRFKRIKKK